MTRTTCVDEMNARRENSLLASFYLLEKNCFFFFK